jgi:hypothetical protein
MKRGVMTLFFIALILVNLVSAQNVSNVTSGFSGIENVTSINLEEEVEIPVGLDIIARIALGTPKVIQVNILVVMVCVWIVLFLLLQKILVMTSFFKGVTSWISAAAMTCILGITGTIKIVAELFYDFASLFGILELWSPLKVILALLIGYALFYALSLVIKLLQKRIELMDSEKKGEDIAKLAKMAEITDETMQDL